MLERMWRTGNPLALLVGIYFLFIYFFNVYLFLGQRETEHEWGRNREGERETQNLKHPPGSDHLHRA